MINAASRSDSARLRKLRSRKLKPHLGEFAQHEGKLPFLFGEVETMLRTLALQSWSIISLLERKPDPRPN